MSVRLPDSIRGRLPYLLSRAYVRQLELFAAHTESFGISGREYAVMLLLEAHPRLWQSQIADALALDRTAVTYVVDSLEKNGLVARHRDTNDRRAFVVCLTEAGGRTLTDIAPAVQRAKQEMLARLDASEQEQLRQLLIRMNPDDE